MKCHATVKKREREREIYGCSPRAGGSNRLFCRTGRLFFYDFWIFDETLLLSRGKNWDPPYLDAGNPKKQGLGLGETVARSIEGRSWAMVHGYLCNAKPGEAKFLTCRQKTCRGATTYC